MSLKGLPKPPKNMQHNSPKPKIAAIKAIIIHVFGVQVGFRVLGFIAYRGLAALE